MRYELCVMECLTIMVAGTTPEDERDLGGGRWRVEAVIVFGGSTPHLT